MTRQREMQALIRRFKEETGKVEVEMHEVARYAHDRFGFPLPQPVDPIDRLAKDFSRAAREETRTDGKTGRPYRANHAYKTTQGDEQYTFWVDIDEATRKTMVKCVTQRREQMVGDAMHVTFDVDHWNALHPDEAPIQVELDFAPDVEWRKNAEAMEILD